MKDPRRRPINDFERIGQYIDDVLSRVDVLRVPITGWRYRTGRHLAPGKYRYDFAWKSYSPEVSWGGEDVTAWFRKTLVVPAAMDGREVYLRLLPGGESILRISGNPVCGFDYNHREYRLAAKASAGRRYPVELECYFRDAPDDSLRNDIRKIHRFELAEMVVKDHELLGLYWDLCAALDLARAVQESNGELFERLVGTLHEAASILDPYAQSAAEYRSKALEARRFLRERLYAGNHGHSPGTLYLVGHSHLDIYFLWPSRESIRKNLRTNLIALELMKRYPPYVFTQSQAKLFADMKRCYPRAFAAVRRLVRKGRFLPVGDMWVEPDCNIVSGEALVRQILYGRKFFRSEFGASSSICWLSDVFGAAASLPQILVQGGFRVFYTTKHSIWRDTNDFPHNTFLWEGIDGTRILSHIPPTHFVGMVDPETLLVQWNEYRQKTNAPHVLYTFGFGDGGGGPTEKMLEYGRRYGEVDAMPRIRFAKPEEFADRLVESARDLPVWADELYLEMHRGANTTKGRLKRRNRVAEASLRAAEILSTVAQLLAGAKAPVRDLEGMWKLLLELHFHDAVTGTHSTSAGLEVEAGYDSLIEGADKTAAAACGALVRRKGHAAKTVFNLTGAARAGHVVWHDKSSADRPKAPAAGVTLASAERVFQTQRLSNGDLVTFVDGLPALGHKALRVVGARPAAGSPFKLEERSMASAHYSLRFTKTGEIESLIDLACGREVLAGPANRLRLFEDKPGRFEAWEIAKDYESRPVNAITFLGFERGECGPLMAGTILKWKIGDSLLRQEVVLYAHSRRIDFRTAVDWREERKLLRVYFPFNVMAKTAVYEIPFGVIERPTRPVSPYDKAKFEVPFLRWFDVAEYGYGVSVLNDGKYGGCVRDSVASISLLKSPRFPDPTSDIGRHEFTYSLLPHEGDWRTAGTFAQAALLNSPLVLAGGAAAPESLDYVRVSRPGIAVESFKKAEDGRGWVLRLVDYFGQRGRVVVELPFGLRKVASCNILEEPSGEPVKPGKRGFFYDCRPFAISSFRLALEEHRPGVARKA